MRSRSVRIIHARDSVYPDIICFSTMQLQNSIVIQTNKKKTENQSQPNEFRNNFYYYYYKLAHRQNEGNRIDNSYSIHFKKYALSTVYAICLRQ